MTNNFAQDLAAHLDNLCDPFDRNDAPGGILAVYYQGRIAFCRPFGMADLQGCRRNECSTVFNGASLAKQFTAAAIALLAIRGALRLDDAIASHIPACDDDGETVTIRHLVHHTSGLADNWSTLKKDSPGGIIDNEAVMRAFLSGRKRAFPPGKKFEYNNRGYILLAEIVHQVSGSPLNEFVAEHIFTPLAMKNSCLGYYEPIIDCAQGHSLNEDGVFTCLPPCDRTLGAGNLYTTVDDLLKWESVFSRSCQVPHLSQPEFLNLLLTRGALNGGEVLDYAFGLARWSYKGHQVISHEAGARGYRADIIRFPSLKLTLLCMLNQDGISPVDLTHQAADMILCRL